MLLFLYQSTNLAWWLKVLYFDSKKNKNVVPFERRTTVTEESSSEQLTIGRLSRSLGRDLVIHLSFGEAGCVFHWIKMKMIWIGECGAYIPNVCSTSGFDPILFVSILIFCIYTILVHYIAHTNQQQVIYSSLGRPIVEHFHLMNFCFVSPQRSQQNSVDLSVSQVIRSPYDCSILKLVTLWFNH